MNAVIDTGFNGFLSLPPNLVIELGPAVVGDGEAVLADGSEAVFEVYGVSLWWDDQPRYVETGAVGLDPLIGMSMLEGHDLLVEVEGGGRVVIQARP